jgi:hypothetical protein
MTDRPTPSPALTSVLHFVFDGPPGSECGRFVECETPDGRSVNADEWHERADGYWELRVPVMQSVAQATPVPTDVELQEAANVLNAHRHYDLAQAVAEARAAIAAMQATPETGWQGIETAPKDGTLVLLWLEPQQPELTISAPTMGEELERIVFGIYPQARRGFYSADRLEAWRKHNPDTPDWAGWSEANSKYRPTHWRSLLRSPASDLGKAKP